MRIEAQAVSSAGKCFCLLVTAAHCILAWLSSDATNHGSNLHRKMENQHISVNPSLSTCQRGFPVESFLKN